MARSFEIFLIVLAYFSPPVEHFVIERNIIDPSSLEKGTIDIQPLEPNFDIHPSESHDRFRRSFTYNSMELETKHNKTENATRTFDKKLITWRISQYPVQKNLHEQTVNQAISMAFERWNKVADIDFQQIYSKLPEFDIDLYFMGDQFDSECYSIFAENELAHTKDWSSARIIHFDGSRNWDAIGDCSKFGNCHNLVQVATREIGRALGLDYSVNNRSIMAPVSGKNNKDLLDEDIKAIRSLYGSRTVDQKLCTPGKFYCGRDLRKMGYKIPSHTSLDYLYECSHDKFGHFQQRCSTRCANVNSTNDAFCTCVPSRKYCGYELRLMNWVDVESFGNISDHHLYQCSRADEVTIVEECPNKCSQKQGIDSLCDINSNTSNNSHQVIGQYCGHELIALQYPNFKPQILYRCNWTGENENCTIVETCENGCFYGMAINKITKEELYFMSLCSETLRKALKPIDLLADNSTNDKDHFPFFKVVNKSQEQNLDSHHPASERHRFRRSINSSLHLDTKNGTTENATKHFDKKFITWHISQYPVQKNLNEETVNLAITIAFEQWSNVTDIDFQQVYSDWPELDIEFIFMTNRFDSDCYSIFERTLAHTRKIGKIATIHFNGIYSWDAMGDCSVSEDCSNLIQVATHEIGHALGLKHSTNNRSVMAPESNWDNDVLIDEDIAAIQSLYGPRKSVDKKLCKPGQFYCSRDLEKMGYEVPTINYLYECTDDNFGNFQQRCSTRCANVNSTNDAFCTCVPGKKYCGYELRMMNWVDESFGNISDHNLYQCSQATKVSMVQKCPNRCIENEGIDSLCDIDSNSNISNRQEAAGLRCGHELIELQYPNFKPQGLYKCSWIDKNLNCTMDQICENGCFVNKKMDETTNQPYMEPFCNVNIRRALKPIGLSDDTNDYFPFLKDVNKSG